jgi:hypothetical protein
MELLRPELSSEAFSTIPTIPTGNEKGNICTLCIEKDRIWTQLNPDRCFPEHVMSLEHPLHGWLELLQLMAQNADLQAFPAFTDLNVKSLLCYQAELTDLREELHKLECRDHLDGRFRFYDLHIVALRCR